MISWTITAPNVFTGSTVRVVSSDTLFSLSGTANYLSTWSDSGGETNSSTDSSALVVESASFSGRSVTIHGATLSSTSYSETFTSSYYSAEQGGGVTKTPTVITSSSSQSGLTTAGLPTSEQQTSTAETITHIYQTVTTSTESLSAYTTNTSYNGQATQTVIDTTEEENTVYTDTTTSTTFTSHATTTSGTVAVGEVRATVLKAEPDEVLWILSAIESWSGYTAATERAVSALQTTISPSYNLVPYPVVIISGGSAVNNEDRSSFFPASSYSFDATTSATASTTITRAINFNVLPNPTTTQTSSVITTRTTNIQHTLYGSNSVSAPAEEFSVTYQTMASTRYKETHSTFFEGSITWDMLQTQTTSWLDALETDVETVETSTSSFFATSLFYETYSSSFTENTAATLQISGYDSQARTLSSTEYTQEIIEKNTAALRPPVASTSLAQSNILQRKFVPSGATLLSSGGNYYTIDNGTTLPFYTAQDNRKRVTTVFPSSNETVTYSKNSVTYTTAVSGTTTTTSALVSVAGQSRTVTTASENIGILGGYPNAGETFVQIAHRGGAFRNLVNEETLTFEIGATTGTDSSALSKVERMTFLAPPFGGGGYTATTIYWTSPRNSVALSPIPLSYA